MDLPKSTIDNSDKPWREGCYCSVYRKPCAYHEGYEDALDDIGSLRSDD